MPYDLDARKPFVDTGNDLAADALIFGGIVFRSLSAVGSEFVLN